MVESRTIGEFIEECYAYPYSKEYYEILIECAQQELKELYYDSMTFAEEAEVYGFTESGATSDPEFFCDFNEAVFYEYTNDDLTTQAMRDEARSKTEDKFTKEGNKKFGKQVKKGIFKRLGDWLKRSFKRFVRTLQKIFSGLKEEYKKITTKQLNEEFVNCVWSKKDIEDTLEVDYWAQKPFGTSSHPALKFEKDVSKDEKAAMNNLVGFLYAVLNKGTIVAKIDSAVWQSFLKKNVVKAKAKYNFSTVHVNRDEMVIQADELVSIFTELENCTKVKDYEKLERRIGSAADKAFRGVTIPLSSEKIDNIIKTITELEDKFDKQVQENNGELPVALAVRGEEALVTTNSNTAIAKRDSNTAIAKRDSNTAIAKRDSNTAIAKRDSNTALSVVPGSKAKTTRSKTYGNGVSVEWEESYGGEFEWVDFYTEASSDETLECAKHLKDINAVLSLAQAHTLKFYVQFKRVYDHAISQLSELRDIAIKKYKKDD